MKYTKETLAFARELLCSFDEHGYADSTKEIAQEAYEDWEERDIEMEEPEDFLSNQIDRLVDGHTDLASFWIDWMGYYEAYLVWKRDKGHEVVEYWDSDYNELFWKTMEEHLIK